AYSMYLIGLFVAIFSAYIISKMTKAKGSSVSNALLIELPEYKAPSSRTILIYVWEKVREYITKAGTTIFLASILVWFVLNIGPNGYVSEMGDSFGAIAGKFISPILAPAGLGIWQVVVALVAGLAAKEIVVSSFSVLFSIGDITSAAGMTSLIGILSGVGFGALNAYSLMVFCLLYTPCIATIAVIKRELKSTRWTIFAISFQLSVAWLVSTLIYQIGSLFI
ncbi:MAG TPA: ferrous iron transporter B, partial [Clostridiales bacterium]|nr:ferrous iron transporter B [Clostridiales bacterium]